MSHPIRASRWRPAALAHLLAWSSLGFTAMGAGAFPLASEGCPMAHCDARMSDLVKSTTPSVGVAVRVDRTSPPAIGGLGCVSNTRLVACTGGGDPAVSSNLVVYDADGNRLWDDGGILGTSAWKSAAIIGDNDLVLAADQNTVLMADPRAGTILWQSAKPDSAPPISPVLAGSGRDLVLIASGAGNADSTPQLSVWDAANGAMLDTMTLVDPISLQVYSTFNTPAVAGNRAYVLASVVSNGTNGRLFALDICESASCGGRGKLSVAWTYDFRGPSGASPLLIGSRLFFDGRTQAGAGTFMAIDDTGTAPSLAWRIQATSTFAASAAQDPRGGLWVYPWQTGKLLRLNPMTGAVLQTVNTSTVLGVSAGYYPVTAVSTSSSPGGAVVLTFGARAAGRGSATPPYVAAVDVSTAPAGTLLWKFKFANTVAANVPTGQFPIVTNATGARRVVVRGANNSTFFVGEP
jgi:outer membrane protein assembly factor BamB